MILGVVMFLDTTPEAWFMKEITEKLVFIKIKNFCSVKENVKRMRSQATVLEKTFPKDISDKGLLSKIYEEPWKPNYKKANNLVKKWAKDLSSHPTKEDAQIAN